MIANLPDTDAPHFDTLLRAAVARICDDRGWNLGVAHRAEWSWDILWDGDRSAQVAYDGKGYVTVLDVNEMYTDEGPKVLTSACMTFSIMPSQIQLEHTLLAVL
jgi:hypothetical protein